MDFKVRHVQMILEICEAVNHGNITAAQARELLTLCGISPGMRHTMFPPEKKTEYEEIS